MKGVRWDQARKVDVKLHGKGKLKSHGARPVHLIISMIRWVRTSRLSIKNSLSGTRLEAGEETAFAQEEKQEWRKPSRSKTTTLNPKLSTLNPKHEP